MNLQLFLSDKTSIMKSSLSGAHVCSCLDYLHISLWSPGLFSISLSPTTSDTCCRVYCMEDSISTSASSVRTLHQSIGHQSQTQVEREQHSSAVSGGSKKNDEGHNEYGFQESRQQTYGAQTSLSHNLVLPSPPDSPGLSRSPSIDSVSESSFPSVSSSFFFSSSAAASPGRSHPNSYPPSHPHSDHEQDEGGRHHSRSNEHGLIIPSLTLPDALRRPTPFGQTLGQLKILVLGGQGAGKSFLTGLLLEDNEDVVDVGTWEDWYGGEDGVYGKVLKASTDWAEQQDSFGLERYEPTKNVEIVELPGYSQDANVRFSLIFPPEINKSFI